ncbi:aspartyl-phosphate phosphatase Spo0E family protein [Thermanaerosceptrum fracticalcis]
MVNFFIITGYESGQLLCYHYQYLTDPEVVQLSQRLDQLLNKYSGKQG